MGSGITGVVFLILVGFDVFVIGAGSLYLGTKLADRGGRTRSRASGVPASAGRREARSGSGAQHDPMPVAPAAEPSHAMTSAQLCAEERITAVGASLAQVAQHRPELNAVLEPLNNSLGQLLDSLATTPRDCGTHTPVVRTASS